MLKELGHYWSDISALALQDVIRLLPQGNLQLTLQVLFSHWPGPLHIESQEPGAQLELGLWESSFFLHTSSPATAGKSHLFVEAKTICGKMYVDLESCFGICVWSSGSRQEEEQAEQ